MISSDQRRDEFIDAYLDLYPVIYSTVYSRIHDKDEADDLCQEIFIIFYNKFDAIENKRSWLYSTAKNVLMNYYKKKRADASEEINEMADFGIQFVNGFRDTRIIIEEAIETIKCDAVERALLDLIAVHEFSYTKVSGIMGLSVKQVRYRYGQIVNRLLHHMRNIGIKDLEELL